LTRREHDIGAIGNAGGVQLAARRREDRFEVAESGESTVTSAAITICFSFVARAL
jgi:hypothetical protein